MRDNKGIVLTLRRLPSLVLAPLLLSPALTSLGCHAQTPAATTVPLPVLGQPLPLPLARRVEVLLRQKAQLPPGSTITVGPASASELPGYDTVAVSFTNDGKTSHPINFLISTDGKTLGQFSKYDISPDPRSLLSAEGRPARGGPASAPVLIVGFDDLECPYCARLHQTIFPAITQRYGDKVRVVYKDFPLDQHPWAMRAAVDVNCLGAQSTPGYWNVVDYIHAHASDIGAPTTAVNPDLAPTPEKTLALANTQIDNLTREQGKFQKVDATKLDACLAKQDTASIVASRKLGETLNVDSTPSLFINGDKIDGALPIQFIFSIIDDALRAENVTPPPPYVAPAPAAPTGGAAPVTHTPGPGK